MVFPDMQGRQDWETQAVDGVTAAGLMNGYPDGTFGPDAPIRRVEAAAVIWRLWQAVLKLLGAAKPRLETWEIDAKVRPSVLRTSAPEVGTAFCLAPGKLCTCWHVVKGGGVFVERVADLAAARGSNWLARDELLDVFLISDPFGLPALPLAAVAPRPGEIVYLLGCGAGTAGNLMPLMWGLPGLNTYADCGNNTPRMLVSCWGPTQGGDSGAPVINCRGELVSMLVADLGGGSRSWVLPMDVFQSCVRRLGAPV